MDMQPETTLLGEAGIGTRGRQASAWRHKDAACSRFYRGEQILRCLDAIEPFAVSNESINLLPRPWTE